MVDLSVIFRFWPHTMAPFRTRIFFLSFGTPRTTQKKDQNGINMRNSVRGRIPLLPGISVGGEFFWTSVFFFGKIFARDFTLTMRKTWVFDMSFLQWSIYPRFQYFNRHPLDKISFFIFSFYPQANRASKKNVIRIPPLGFSVRGEFLPRNRVPPPRIGGKIIYEWDIRVVEFFRF